jgi:hypothetical protein
MTLSIFLIAQTFGNNPDQKRYERTLESMGEIKKAILGTHSERVRGDIKFAGYVEDMGDLPELYGGQSKGLWTNDPVTGETVDDLPSQQNYSACDFHSALGKGYPISLGWRGPYLKPPEGDVLKDAWGNPFIFERKGNDNDFVIRSRGADGKQGGTGYDEDIELIIKENNWLASVAGYISPYTVYHDKGTPVKAVIYYAPISNYAPNRNLTEWLPIPVWDVTEGVEAKEVTVDEDGYFHFNKVPIGTERLLAIVQPTGSGVIFQPYKIDIEPGLNWLGNMVVKSQNRVTPAKAGVHNNLK